ncbi:molybdopterin-dependent oxidoreductase [Bradyrhizobium jicamae]|uniref:Molybdopterin-dependent oxidoreductase n=1 Tax=Bradyrhizobium jicamae TaxID=280332 RepID=A0ABS5FKS4_9BRAD|nr:nitrate reductase [Bradyrhizobium jicamae]MBR0797383.1 molybdopterin-dependent oxidoreductase [Bradyrhizobium jicamae]
MPVKTTCPYCGVGCGVVADRDADGKVTVSGDREHPANFGRLCSKGSALAETIGLEGRLLAPLMNGQPATWDDALDHVAGQFARIIREHGPDAVAFYVSGQLLTEDYYVVNKLSKGFVGTANIDTNSRLCMASSVVGHKRAFGSDTVPGCYEDLEQADLLVLVGSNSAWCHPILHQRMLAAKEKNPACRIVVIDPRRTATCEGADLHLPLRAGSDVMLFNGLLAYLAGNNVIDRDFVGNVTSGVADALAQVAGQTVARTAGACGLTEGTLELFFDWFARTERVVTLYSQGVNQSTSGVDKVNAIINCHLLTGRIGRPGMGPFSLTGQPNAMGGREVGGLANQLAAHMDLENAAHRDIVQRFWRAPVMAEKGGLKAVDMFDAIADGRIKAVWIMSTNPVVSLPDADRVRAALDACELVVVSDCMRHTDTTRHAHVLLPALAWGEKDGTVTNSERRISRQRPFLPPPGEARADWRIVCDVARRMGYAGFDYAAAAEVFREHAELSGFENGGRRDFDISALATCDDQAYEALEPVQWPVTRDAPSGTARMFETPHFFTPDHKARFVAVKPRAARNATSRDYPLVLNTGRVRDQWHTMTRTGKTARLLSHIFEPYAEFHPEDARMAGVKHDGLARLTSPWGKMIARVVVTSEQRRGCVFVPMHWNEEFAGAGRVNALVNPAVDPLSGQPESKHTPVKADPFRPKWHAFILSRNEITRPASGYWVHGQAGNCWRLELTGNERPESWRDWARTQLGLDDVAIEWIAYRDPAAGRYRYAAVRDGRLEGCVFIAPNHTLPSRVWLIGLFAEQELSANARMSLLAGQPFGDGEDRGAIVCSCFGIGRNQITAEIRNGADSVEAIGQCLKAGTNCGGCKPEISKLIATTAIPLPSSAAAAQPQLAGSLTE